MNSDVDTWQIQISLTAGGRPSGLGFIISPDQALTCTHNLSGNDQVWIRKLGNSPFGAICRATPCDPAWNAQTNPWLDVAVIYLPRGFAGPTAPIGPISRPSLGAPLYSYGFPAGFEIPGQRADVTVRGAAPGGPWLQVEPVAQSQGRLAKGFSGAAAVDPLTDHVRGMVAWATGSPGPGVAYIIPIDVIATVHPAVRPVAARAYVTEPAVVAGRRALRSGRYEEARREIMPVLMDHPEEPELYFLAALSVLAGFRPAEHHARTIDEVERLLARGRQSAPGDPRLAALWSLVKDDYFGARALPPGRPTLIELDSGMRRLSPVDAALIVQHISAPESRIWSHLKRRSAG